MMHGNVRERAEQPLAREDTRGCAPASRVHLWHGLGLIFCLTLLSPGSAAAEKSLAGKYLYANPENVEQFTGSLTLTFAEPGEKLVVAYGRKWRKDRKTRQGTTEKDREAYKPWKAKVIENGTKAIFWHLPRDYYDIVVVREDKMLLYEGIQLMRTSDPNLGTGKLFKEVEETLSPRKDRIGGWEGFFDNKQFNRLETDGTQGCMFLQQMRLGKALAESGAVLKGCIHSIDMCWVERGKVEGAGWQVVTRQQLYRAEIPARTFFKHAFVKDLQGIRVGTKAKEVGPIKLP